jgi:DNA-binding Lrp family transcriptional regulator
MPSREIQKIVRGIGHEITERAIRHRLHRLERNNIILGYSAIVNPSLVSEKLNRTIILKFKNSSNSSVLIERLSNYVEEAPFCVYSARLHGGEFDWVSHFIFESVEQYELESNNFLHLFADLILEYRSYESKALKASPYTLADEHDIIERKSRVYKILSSIQRHDNLNDKLQQTVESVVKYFDAKFARIWLVDNEKKFLILKFSAGKYKNIHGEFSKVSVNSVKIGHIVKNKKPVITNDVANDPRIKYHDWAKKENLKSFAGYPLIYNSQAIGVLAMFSEKKLNLLDFEILGIFCDQISRELISFFEAQKFLSI